MPLISSARRSKLTKDPRTKLKPATNTPVNCFQVKSNNHTVCTDKNGQISSAPKRFILTVPSIIRSISGTDGFRIEVGNQTVPHETTALLKATLILDGTPILISRKVASPDPEIKLHSLDVVSLELFSANKKTLPLKSALIQTTTLSSIRDQDHKHDESVSPVNTIHPVPRRESEELAAQLLTTLDESLGNTAILPSVKSRRVYLHYADNEVSPEEKMAQMARYAYTPKKAGEARKSQSHLY
jgi:hypothetical protein